MLGSWHLRCKELVVLQQARMTMKTLSSANHSPNILVSAELDAVLAELEREYVADGDPLPPPSMTRTQLTGKGDAGSP
jgi:hypothetical protein